MEAFSEALSMVVADMLPVLTGTVDGMVDTAEDSLPDVRVALAALCPEDPFTALLWGSALAGFTVIGGDIEKAQAEIILLAIRAAVRRQRGVTE
jgi:hypothetical protein